MKTILASSLFFLTLPAWAQEKLDLYGDPLPAGGDVRLGTMRFRHADHRSHDMYQHQIIFHENRTVVPQFDGSLRFWDADTGKLQRQFDLGEDRVSYACFSPDRKTIATMSRQTVPHTSIISHYRTRFWDLESGKLMSTLATRDGFYRAVFTSDGNTYLTVSGGTIEVWDVSSSERLLSVTLGENEEILGLDISPLDNQVIALATAGKVYLWDWLAGKEPIVLAERNQHFTSVVFSPTQPIIATIAHRDRTIQIWDAAQRKMVHEIRPTKYRPQALIFTPDGKSLIGSCLIDSRSFKSGLMIWDSNTWTLQRTIELNYRRPTVLAVSPDSKRVAARDKGCIAVFDLNSGKRLPGNLVCHEWELNSVVFSPDSKLAVTAADDATVRVWDAESGRQLFKLPHSPLVGELTAAISPDGRRIASLGNSDVLHIWDTQTGKELHRMTAHGALGSHFRLAFTPDSKRLMSFGDDLFLRVWEVDSGKQLAEHNIQPNNFNTLINACFSVNGDRFVLTIGKTTYVFNTHTGQEIGQFSGDFYGSRSASPDGTRLLTVTHQWPDSTKQSNHDDQAKEIVRIHELPSGREIWKTVVPGSDWRVPAAFSPDGRLIAVGIPEPINEIRIWDVKTKKQLLTIDDVPGIAYGNTLAFSADNRKLACAQTDYSVLIWNLNLPIDPEKNDSESNPN